MRANVTNVEVAEKLGVQHTTVSRWRSGDRVPNRATMLKIADEFDFNVMAQMTSASQDAYDFELEKALIAKFGEAKDDSATPA